MNKNVDDELLGILACPVCNGDIEVKNNYLRCKKCSTHYRVENDIPVMLPPHLGEEQKMAIETWGQEYEKLLFDAREGKHPTFLDQYALSDYDLISRFARKSDKKLLEVGCGRARLSLLVSKQGLSIVGFDLSIAALVLAKYTFTAHGLRGKFVCGDIMYPPFKSGSFNVAFAGGSIEHFDNTLQGVRAIANLLSDDGLFIATVPFVSLSVILQGFLTGNIPDVPILRSFLKFLHIRLMNKRHFMYGYEKSFTQRGLCAIFHKAKLHDLEVGPYRTNYTLKFFKNQWSRKLIKDLIRLRPFWPMVYIKGKKSQDRL